MSLEDFYFIAQIISALAIVGSLLFVGLQLREQNREQLLARSNEALENHDQFQRLLVENSDFREIWIKGRDGMEDLTPSERLAFGAYLALWMGTMMRTNARRKAGYTINPLSGDGEAKMYRSITQREGPRQWWTRARAQYHPDVRKLGDALFGMQDHSRSDDA